MGRSGGNRSAIEQKRDLDKVPPKNFVPFTEEELWQMTRQEVTQTLNERQARWCEIYVKSFNADLAAIKAGYSKKSAHAVSNRIRKREDVRTYLAWLKLRAIETLDIKPIDILEQYAKIGFADITDYVTLKNGRLTLEDSDKIDGQVVKSYKTGSQGTTIELYDKITALRHLEQFFSEMPKSWRQRLEERRLELAEEKLALEKEAMGNATEQQAELGSSLIRALMGVAKDVWTNDEETGKALSIEEEQKQIEVDELEEFEDEWD